jgi:hypothetical protein
VDAVKQRLDDKEEAVRRRKLASANKPSGLRSPWSPRLPPYPTLDVTARSGQEDIVYGYLIDDPYWFAPVADTMGRVFVGTQLANVESWYQLGSKELDAIIFTEFKGETFEGNQIDERSLRGLRRLLERVALTLRDPDHPQYPVRVTTGDVPGPSRLYVDDEGRLRLDLQVQQTVVAQIEAGVGWLEAEAGDQDQAGPYRAYELRGPFHANLQTVGPSLTSSLWKRLLASHSWEVRDEWSPARHGSLYTFVRIRDTHSRGPETRVSGQTLS